MMKESRPKARASDFRSMGPKKAHFIAAHLVWQYEDQRYPRTALTSASPRLVLLAVASITAPPGRSKPSCSA
jgi:hypothetical protein